jgi:hypothetical protein
MVGGIPGAQGLPAPLGSWFLLDRPRPGVDGLHRPWRRDRPGRGGQNLADRGKARFGSWRAGGWSALEASSPSAFALVWTAGRQEGHGSGRLNLRRVGLAQARMAWWKEDWRLGIEINGLRRGSGSLKEVGPGENRSDGVLRQVRPAGGTRPSPRPLATLGRSLFRPESG